MDRTAEYHAAYADEAIDSLRQVVRMRHQSMRRMTLSGLVLLLGTMFGLQYAAARLMGLSGVHPMPALLLIHVGMSALFISGLVLNGKLFRPSVVQAGFFIIVALFGNLGQLGIELMAAHHVPAGELTLIISLLPIFVLLMTSLMRSEPITLRKACGILLGVAASAAILMPNALQGHAQLYWLLLAFASPVSQAFGMVIMARFWPGTLEPLQVATGNMVAGTLMLAPLVLGSGESLETSWLWSEGGFATGLFALTVAAEFYLLAIITRRGGAVLASTADFVAVCAGLGFGYVLFAEVPGAWMMIAAAFCMIAMKLVSDQAPSVA